MTQVRLVLADGAQWTGQGIGHWTDATGEVIFYNADHGYQQIITDPALAGKIVVLTAPLIGNQGIPHIEGQDVQVSVSALIAREICSDPRLPAGTCPLPDYLARQQVPAAHQFDTRALMRHIRNKPCLRGILTTDLQSPPADLIARTGQAQRERAGLSGQPRDIRVVGKGSLRLVLLDLGVRPGFADLLATTKHCCVIVVSAGTTPDEIAALHPDGIIVSDGPQALEHAASWASQLRSLWRIAPVFGIGLGMQLLVMALGGDVATMSTGHWGKYTVRDVQTGRTFTTLQNHGRSVLLNRLAGTQFVVTHVNTLDGSVEGIVHRDLPLYGLQFYPDLTGDPNLRIHLFDHFIEKLKCELVPSA